MLLTICPNCAAQFKVQPEQLNVRQGRVMCGRCRQVFNAFQSLTREVDVSDPQMTSLRKAVANVSHDEPSLSFTAAGNTAEVVADSLFMRDEPSPLPAAFSASEPPLTRVVPPVALPPPVDFRGLADHIRHEENGPKDGAGFQLPDLKRLPVEPGIDLSSEYNPLLVEAPVNRVPPTRRTSRAWSFGAFLLIVCLMLQAVYAFRTSLVSNYPQLRPAIGELCELAGCSLSWGRDEAVLVMDASELIEAPGKTGRILLTAILVNRGKTKQDLPSLDLRLTDNANQVVVSRLLQPGDYLGRAVAKDEGLLPNTELYVNVALQLDAGNRPPASGYEVKVFYP